MTTETSQPVSRRGVRIAPFLLALVCFLLPFVELSCQGQRLARFTGAELAFGATMEQKDPWTGRVQERKIQPEPFATIAFLTILLAIALAWGGRDTLALVSGGIALGSLWMTMARLDQQAAKEASGLLRIGYQPAYWICMLLLALGLGAIWRWRHPESDG